MAVDPLSPIAPARLRALLVPVGKIKRSRFLDLAKRLQSYNVVRLGDVSPDGKPNDRVTRRAYALLFVQLSFSFLESWKLLLINTCAITQMPSRPWLSLRE